MDIREAKRQRCNAASRKRNRQQKRIDANAGLTLDGVAVGDGVRLRWTGYPGVPQWLSGGSAKVVKLLRKRVVIEALAEPGVHRTIDRNQFVTDKDRFAATIKELESAPGYERRAADYRLTSGWLPGDEPK